MVFLKEGVLPLYSPQVAPGLTLREGRHTTLQLSDAVTQTMYVNDRMSM